jgi:hypothetical protein
VVSEDTHFARAIAVEKIAVKTKNQHQVRDVPLSLAVVVRTVPRGSPVLPLEALARPPGPFRPLRLGPASNEPQASGWVSRQLQGLPSRCFEPRLESQSHGRASSQDQGNYGSLGLAECGAGPGAGCVIRDTRHPAVAAHLCVSCGNHRNRSCCRVGEPLTGRVNESSREHICDALIQTREFPL